jgi:hypothetical protein
MQQTSGRIKGEQTVANRLTQLMLKCKNCVCIGLTNRGPKDWFWNLGGLFC